MNFIFGVVAIRALTGRQLLLEDFLLQDFAVIMTVAGVALVLFRFINQPPALGYLVAGVIVGPFTLPLLGIASPVHSHETIKSLAELGLSILLFAIGLEFGWRRIRMLGFPILLIGTVEVLFMVALGYQLGQLLGWTAIESIFLGAAVCISSSAIILKMLRDTGALFSTHGRLIVGLLVVQDFAAVILLSILSGVPSAEAIQFSDLGPLIGKLLLFLLSVLILGGVLAPRLIGRVGRFHSPEMLIVVGLALCFGLALAADRLGLSAAAGAFIIGAVLGDAEYAEDLVRNMAPVRDVFSALFFVSIGMLIDISGVGEFIVPAIIVTAMFIVGKTFIDTVATLFIGHIGNTPARVGFGMPQMGEFSLAMVREGSDHGSVGSFMYPVMAISVALTSLVYPFIFRSADGFTRIVSSVSPLFIKRSVFLASNWMESARTAFNLTNAVGEQFRDATKALVANAGVIVVLIAVGTFALNYARPLSDVFGVRETFVGIGVVVLVGAFSLPPAIFIWRALGRMIDAVSDVLLGEGGLFGLEWDLTVRAIIRDAVLFTLLALLAVFSLPFLSGLLSIGSFVVPTTILIFIVIVVGAWRLLSRLHHSMEDAFRLAFLDADEEDASSTPSTRDEDSSG